jgi:hypothetical protein
MYIIFKTITTHAHQQVIFSYEVLLYAKEEKKKIEYSDMWPIYFYYVRTTLR